MSNAKQQDRDGGQAGEVSELIFNTVGSPIRTCSLYYSLYYLDEIVDEDGAAYDLSVIEDNLYDGFFWYGVHAITNEVTNMGKRLIVDGVPYGELDKAERRNFIHDNINYDDIDSILPVLVNSDSIPSSGSKKWVKKEFDNINETSMALSKSYEYINGIKGIFDIKGKRLSKSEAIDNNETVWTRGFGGDSWVSICDHLMGREDEMKRIWVDKSWSIQHNTGTWLNKVSLSLDQRLKIVQNMTIDELLEIGSLNDSRLKKARQQSPSEDATLESIAQNINVKFIQKKLLPQILDSVFEEEMDKVFRFSSWYNDEVGPDMRLWRRRLS